MKGRDIVCFSKLYFLFFLKFLLFPTSPDSSGMNAMCGLSKSWLHS